MADSQCIDWWGSVRPDGYGYIIVQGKHERAHRFIWRECFGEMAAGTVLHHKCHNKMCVNPEHLEPHSRADHNRVHGADVTRCPRGHEYTPENTYLRRDPKRGWTTRKCRACHKAQESERYHGRHQN